MTETVYYGDEEEGGVPTLTEPVRPGGDTLVRWGRAVQRIPLTVDLGWLRAFGHDVDAICPRVVKLVNEELRVGELLHRRWRNRRARRFVTLCFSREFSETFYAPGGMGGRWATKKLEGLFNGPNRLRQ